MVEVRHSVANGSPPLQYFFKEAELAGCNDREMGLANSLHVLALYSEFTKRFDSINYSTKYKQIVCF